MTIRIRKNPIVSDEELNIIYQQMVLKSNETNLNPYDTYIEERRLNNLTRVEEREKPRMEKHHIIPCFDQGPDTPENIILLTVKEHVIAHWLRWKVLNKKGDYCAFLFRIGDTEQALALRQQLVREARERDRIEGNGFFNSSFQREMGTRGGSIGGSRNTSAQFLARQTVGLTYGRETGINNQGGRLNLFVSNFSIWAYSLTSAQNPGKRGVDRSDEQFFLVSPKKAFIDITRVLDGFVYTKITNPPSMHKVIYEQRPQMYGWRIVKTLTRSEVRKGIQKFIQENPTIILRYEEDLILGDGLE